MKTLTELQKEINDWQDSVFTKATALSAVAHLQREVIELTYALQTKHLKRDSIGQDDIQEELSDCFILLMAVAHLSNIILEPAVEEKMAINRRRIWGKPDAEGVVEHIHSHDAYLLNADGEIIGSTKDDLFHGSYRQGEDGE